ALIAEKRAEEVIQACDLASQVYPGCANGLPLRRLGMAGVDSKFFERHRSLIIKLLDVRFNGLVSELGLETFLGALDETDHWLLVADLDGSLLPFRLMRVRHTELLTNSLPGSRLLIVENERCVHQLPKV